MGKVIDLKDHPKSRTHARKSMAREIRKEMQQNEHQELNRPQAVEGFRPGAFKDMPKSLKDFLVKLKVPETKEAIEIAERIVLDVRVHDLSFTSTLVYLRSSKDEKVIHLYQQLRAAILVTIGVALPTFEKALSEG